MQRLFRTRIPFSHGKCATACTPVLFSPPSIQTRAAAPVHLPLSFWRLREIARGTIRPPQCGAS